MPIEIGSEPLEDLDTIENGLSSHQRLRRTQAKKLARKLYSLYHEDKQSSSVLPWITFAQIRDLAKQGELELIWYIRCQHGLEEMTSESLVKARTMIKNRLMILQATPAYRFTRLYVSNKDMYVEEMSRVLNKRIFDLQSKISEMYLEPTFEGQLNDCNQ